MKPKQTASGRKLMDRLAPEPLNGRLLGILATTYEMQPEFFETDFLPTLFGLGAWDDRAWSSRIGLEKQLAELDAATLLLDSHPYRGRPRSLRVEVVPVSLAAGRILHAKVVICVHDEAVRLIVGSANLTEPGYRRNREVVAVLEASAKRPTDAALIAGAIREMNLILAESLTASRRQLLDLALERLDQWKITNLDIDQWAAWSGGDRSLFQQFVEHWPSSDQVEQITIVSPFWSEERENGPVTTLVNTLRGQGWLKSDAQLSLLTEAAPDKETTYKPKLPESFGAFDARSLGVDAVALAVDPRVPPDEVGLGEEFTGTRALHAKIVLFEGSMTSLIYVGSANFSRHGWGFLADPRRANIEAGFIVKRSGEGRSILRNLIPKTIGKPVPLAGAAAGKLALPDPSPEERPWPTFLREVVLQPSATDPEHLDLVVNIANDVSGPWSIAHLLTKESPRQVLLSVEEPDPGKTTYNVSITDDVLSRLLREQEIHVEWWQFPEGRSFPLNVSFSARTSLPVSPGTGQPNEQDLIAYYQGRISWEDLFPDPESGHSADPVPSADDNNNGVDTSRIQSYIIREFVEALRGIEDDLKLAAQSPKACMRLALLGFVSPVALAKRIVEAVEARERTPTATAFQLVELIACLESARQFGASSHNHSDWIALVDEAVQKVGALLDTLTRRYPNDLSTEFQRYARKVRQHHRQQVEAQ